MFAKIDVTQFTTCFLNWIQIIQKKAGRICRHWWEVITAISRPNIRGKAIYIVDAWASDNQMTLGQKALIKQPSYLFEYLEMEEFDQVTHQYTKTINNMGGLKFGSVGDLGKTHI